MRLLTWALIGGAAYLYWKSKQPATVVNAPAAQTTAQLSNVTQPVGAYSGVLGSIPPSLTPQNNTGGLYQTYQEIFTPANVPVAQPSVNQSPTPVGGSVNVAPLPAPQFNPVTL